MRTASISTAIAAPVATNACLSSPARARNALLIDAVRTATYARDLADEFARLDLALLGAAVASAFLGAWLGNRMLKKVTLTGVQRVVAAFLFVFAIGLVAGLL